MPCSTVAAPLLASGETGVVLLDRDTDPLRGRLASTLGITGHGSPLEYGSGFCGIEPTPDTPMPGWDTSTTFSGGAVNFPPFTTIRLCAHPLSEQIVSTSWTVTA